MLVEEGILSLILCRLPSFPLSSYSTLLLNTALQLQLRHPPSPHPQEFPLSSDV